MLCSCGISGERELFLLEWNGSEGAIKHTYQGFYKNSLDILQFDMTKNLFLDVGDEYLIKLCDVDNTNLLSNVDADVGLDVWFCIFSYTVFLM